MDKNSTDLQPLPGATAMALGREPQAAAHAHQSPHVVIRGETLTPIAHIDWLGLTLPYRANEPLERVKRRLIATFNLPADAWQANERGWFGYENRIDLGNYGLLAYGGPTQKNTLHIEINGQGCARVPDWEAVADWAYGVKAKITRVDLAHDDLEGQTVSMPVALEWFREGGFSATGRPPQARYIDDLDSGKGKTLYIGSRGSGKLLRAYEKGRQLGDPSSPWFRVELELRAQNRQIPLDVLLDPADYLAGSFPCLAHLSNRQCKLKTLQKAGSISYERMTAWVRIAAGRSLNAMCQVHQGDAAAVLTQVMRDGLPKRLADFADHLPNPVNGGER